MVVKANAWQERLAATKRLKTEQQLREKYAVQSECLRLQCRVSTTDLDHITRGQEAFVPVVLRSKDPAAEEAASRPCGTHVDLHVLQACKPR